MTDAAPTLTPRGIRSDDGRPWVSVHTRPGYVDLDTHGLPRPLGLAETVHLIGRLAAAATRTFGAAAAARALAVVSAALGADAKGDA